MPGFELDGCAIVRPEDGNACAWTSIGRGGPRVIRRQQRPRRRCRTCIVRTEDAAVVRDDHGLVRLTVERRVKRNSVLIDVDCGFTGALRAGELVSLARRTRCVDARFGDGGHCSPSTSAGQTRSNLASASR